MPKALPIFAVLVFSLASLAAEQADTADYARPVIMPEHPLLVRPDYAPPRK